MFENVEEVNGQIVNNQWVEWHHVNVPNKPNEVRDFIRFILSILGHCMDCTTLDGCYFIERNMPKFPQHDNCDCEKIKISKKTVISKAYAECSIEKFTKYVFSDEKKSKGKKAIFESFGFTSKDSEVLKHELEKQSLSNYLLDNYLLKDLDANGQRLAIPITLAGKSFYTGWMLEPEGKIRNITPFGGWVK